MFNICIIRYICWVSINIIKYNILIRVLRVCILVIDYMYILNILLLYNVISNYYNFKLFIKVVVFNCVFMIFWWIFL